MHGATAVMNRQGDVVQPTPAFSQHQYQQDNQASQNHHVPHHQFDGETMHISRTNKDRNFRAKREPEFPAPDADLIFISSWARRYSAKEGAALTGMTASGFKKVQGAENSIRHEHLAAWMRSDPDFAAAHAAHVGLILPGEAEYAGALTRAVNARARMEADRK